MKKLTKFYASVFAGLMLMLAVNFNATAGPCFDGAIWPDSGECTGSGPDCCYCPFDEFV